LDSVGDGESSIALYTSEPSVPQRLNVRSLLPAQRSTVKAMCTRIKTLKITRLTAINLYNSSLGQRLERQVVAASAAVDGKRDVRPYQSSEDHQAHGD
jgi:hypothetical protein